MHIFYLKDYKAFKRKESLISLHLKCTSWTLNMIVFIFMFVKKLVSNFNVTCYIYYFPCHPCLLLCVLIMNDYPPKQDVIESNIWKGMMKWKLIHLDIFVFLDSELYIWISRNNFKSFFLLKICFYHNNVDWNVSCT